jgi:TolA-binding protein
MTCARYADLDFVERYVLGQMDEAEQATFEAHYFECPDCFAAVQALQTTQSVLRETAAQAATPSPQPTSTPPNRVVDFSTHPARGKNGEAGAPGRSTGPRLLSSGATWIGLAAAASLAGMLIWSPWRSRESATRPEGTVSQQQPAPPTAQPTQQPTQAQTPTKPEPAPSQSPTASPSGGGATTKPVTASPAPTRSLVTLEALALVTPPPYIPLQTRGADGAAEAFASAMTKYAAKDYRGAIDGLKPIVDAQPEAAHAAFFLGVSYLAAGDAASASAVLNRVAASNAAPFADEAHFYLAKAALRAHDLDRAERELSLASERQAGPAGEAARLLQAVRTYRRDHNQN